MSDIEREPQRNSFAEFYQTAYPQAVQELRTAGRIGAVMLRCQQDAGDWSDAASPNLVIPTLLSGAVTGIVDVGAGVLKNCTHKAGSFVVHAPNVASTFIMDGPHDIHIFAVPYLGLISLAGQDNILPAHGDFGSLHADIQRDAEVSSILQRFWRESAAHNPHGSLWADGAMLQLAAALLRMREGKQAQPRTSLLADWQIRRVERHMSDRLMDDVTLEDLARLVDLSPFHFARSFKNSTGETPLRHFMRRRVERAQELLSGTSMSITDIAHACGFASSQHMATVFRRLVGATPGGYRRERR
jgi:AraC family transcriptional regulator